MLSGLPMAMVTSKASSKVDLLNDDTYRLVCATVNCVFFQTKKARCALNKDSIRKAFLEHTVAELVNEKPTGSLER